MKKFKVLIASMLGAIALVFACITGARVNAATSNYSFNYSAITVGDGTTNKPADKAALSQAMLGEANAFMHIKNGETVNSKVTYRTSSVIEIVEDNLSVSFSGTGSITIGVASTGSSNTSVFGLKNSNDEYLIATTVDSGITLLSDPGDYGNYQFSGTTIRDLSYTINASGTYTFVSSYEYQSGKSRGCRIKTVAMIDENLSNQEKVEAAIAAIENIGTVSYSSTTLANINTATNKISICENGISDIQTYDANNSTNYASTYTTSVEAFSTLKAAAITNFVNAVESIGTVSSTSGAAINAAYGYYDVLFGDELTNTSVVSAKNNLDVAKNTYDDLMYSTYSKTATFASLSKGDYVENFDVTGTIYSCICSSSKKLTVDNTRKRGDYTGAIKTNGASTFTNGSEERVIKFKAKKAGTLKVFAEAGGDSDTRKVAVYKIGQGSNTLIDNSNTTVTSGDLYSISIDSEGEYIIGAEGGSIWFYQITFIENVSALLNCQYDTENPANATKIRFIATLGGISDVTTIDTVTFSVTVGGVTREFMSTKLYSSIANVYSSFGSATGRYYAVYALSGIETAIANSVEIESLSVTVTFTSASGLASITASHAGFTLGTTGA